MRARERGGHAGAAVLDRGPVLRELRHEAEQTAIGVEPPSATGLLPVLTALGAEPDPSIVSVIVVSVPASSEPTA